ncbi:hypothetical protein LY622_21410 [Halomonas sp. M5N1S17]|uniref:hypothetical protein n=1 Tax=Halomonas alkalisoli TaxID=2907158 RepID=UPI001F18C64C|nr:hypothetical protein [Halomonas alkalisoli]MCE9665992.1 hypothetical protein [Halomonas alkalisoli]
MASLDDFLEEMQAQVSLSAAERRRLAALWPDAERAARVCLARMPGIGVLSFSRRAKAFLFVSRALDDYVEKGELDQEQAQLALTIMRLQSRRFRKAESMFSARASRFSQNELASLPETARIFLKAMWRHDGHRSD